MRITKDPTHKEPHMVIEANICGDYLPQTVTVHHNGREIEYVTASKIRAFAEREILSVERVLRHPDWILDEGELLGRKRSAGLILDILDGERYAVSK